MFTQANKMDFKILSLTENKREYKCSCTHLKIYKMLNKDASTKKKVKIVQHMSSVPTLWLWIAILGERYLIGVLISLKKLLRSSSSSRSSRSSSSSSSSRSSNSSSYCCCRKESQAVNEWWWFDVDLIQYLSLILIITSISYYL